MQQALAALYFERSRLSSLAAQVRADRGPASLCRCVVREPSYGWGMAKENMVCEVTQEMHVPQVQRCRKPAPASRIHRE